MKDTQELEKELKYYENAINSGYIELLMKELERLFSSQAISYFPLITLLKKKEPRNKNKNMWMNVSTAILEDEQSEKHMGFKYIQLKAKRNIAKRK